MLSSQLATLAPREIWPATRAKILLSVSSSFSIRILSCTSDSCVPVIMVGSINSLLSSSLRVCLRIVSITSLLCREKNDYRLLKISEIVRRLRPLLRPIIHI